MILNILVLFFAAAIFCFAQNGCYIDKDLINSLKMTHYELTGHLDNLLIVGRNIQATKQTRIFLDLYETMDEKAVKIEACLQVLDLFNIYAKDMQCNKDAAILIKNYILSARKDIRAAKNSVEVLVSGSKDNLFNSEAKESLSLLDKIDKSLNNIFKQLQAQQK